jgi:arylsulfatase A-like enzyme
VQSEPATTYHVELAGQLAANGLRYTQMHNAALCSPTRVGTISGRNHHSMGYGVIAEASTGFPGYDAIIGPDRATIGTILKDNGYATSWFGKDHNTPTWTATEVGPFDNWPSGYGFEYFYGFPVGETNQWTLYLFRNHTAIFPWRGKPPGTWNLTTAMADEAIDWLRRIDATHPDKPFLLYYAPGARTRPTNRPRSGSTRSASCTSSTRAGTSCARRSSPIRRSSA